MLLLSFLGCQLILFTLCWSILGLCVHFLTCFCWKKVFWVLSVCVSVHQNKCWILEWFSLNKVMWMTFCTWCYVVVARCCLFRRYNRALWPNAWHSWFMLGSSQIKISVRWPASWIFCSFPQFHQANAWIFPWLRARTLPSTLFKIQSPVTLFRETNHR
jgi:hypothetical protein